VTDSRNSRIFAGDLNATGRAGDRFEVCVGIVLAEILPTLSQRLRVAGYSLELLVLGQ
jgi:endonuclease/exonuclease/phosphatase (EEP) superfamily protein YafD